MKLGKITKVTASTALFNYCGLRQRVKRENNKRETYKIIIEDGSAQILIYLRIRKYIHGTPVPRAYADFLWQKCTFQQKYNNFEKKVFQNR